MDKFRKIVEKLAHLLAGKVEKNGTPFATLANQLEKLPGLGTLVRKVEKLARLWHVGT